MRVETVLQAVPERRSGPDICSACTELAVVGLRSNGIQSAEARHAGATSMGAGALLIFFYGFVIFGGIIIFYVFLNVAVERAPGTLTAFFIIGLLITYVAFR
ncbi:hypothetical protein HAP47_0002385 [Bradyrhizobium sp. 41S5]|uniref:hypothetical protein n=1 Tax=Bradyrhizobium sp. 41S5 TaxID=1404443 RepID=UPI00156B8B05|nr:hypothetical protein [Bradyrhizobium sp. 41S5]UFX45599.1 hypothetical protein HAP47_0002385 [Bradyrhizobium sp. 41S5]